MPPPETLLAWLHQGAAGLWLVAALVLLASGRSTGAAALFQRLAIAAMAGTLPHLLREGGWWVDLPGRFMVPALAAGAALSLFGPRRLLGQLATLALAGFCLAVAAASARNGWLPLHPWLAAKAWLMGLALLLAAFPATDAPRVRAGATVALLLAAGLIGMHAELPFL
jgi:hypothetical protein